jgi:DNA polymerase-4
MRKIIHIDMDAFFAAVEERDFPEIKGKPVIVGGNPDSRGVVATCNYEARKYGVHSAMPLSRAKRMCPGAVFMPVRFDAYRKVSIQILNTFKQITDLVEPLSLDEAYLDVTENHLNISSAIQIAKIIKKDIFEKTQLTSSAGVSYNKFLAKIASGMNKPNGLTVILPQDAEEFLEKLKIGSFYGIGEKTESKMKSMGIENGFDLKSKSINELVAVFGKMGSFYYEIVRGIDNRKVEPFRKRKSLGLENTFSTDLKSHEEIKNQFLALIQKFWERKTRKSYQGKTISIKWKYSDFSTHTKSYTSNKILEDREELTEAILDLSKSIPMDQSIRLLGISMQLIDESRDTEPGLFENLGINP